MNVEVNTPDGWLTVESATGFRLDDGNLIIWSGKNQDNDLKDLAFFPEGHWSACVRQETA